jgi:hypothetical protein
MASCVGEYDVAVESSSLSHVAVVAGTPAEWLSTSVAGWVARLEQLVSGVNASGPTDITLLPHHGELLGRDQIDEFNRLFSEVAGQTVGELLLVELVAGDRWVWRRDDGVSVVIDPCSDGHVRFATAVAGLRNQGVVGEAVTEEILSTVLLAPFDTEVDLLVIVGPADRIPSSPVWEMAYSEFVYLDLSWSSLQAEHLELAVDDFNRRHRRFGGLDP